MLVAVPAPHFQTICCFVVSSGRLTVSLPLPGVNGPRHPVSGVAGHVAGGSEVEVVVVPMVLDVDVVVAPPMVLEVVVVVPPPPVGVVTTRVVILGLRSVGTPDVGVVWN